MHILEPTKWRASLSYKQGKAVKREELKQQSRDFVKKYFDKPYDEKGQIAFSGDIIIELLDYLKEDYFLKIAPPKSTGREQYSVEFMEMLSEKFDFDKYDKKD